MARRVRDVLVIALRLEAGEAPQKIKTSAPMSPWAAEKRIAEARRADVDALRRALEALADLELASRGGSELADDTAAVRAIATIAA
jgi:DNA polymerase-3 subunit delta